jgi:hypothetical protein
LTAALALTIHLSTYFDDQLQPLLEALEARSTVLRNLDGVTRDDVKKLIREVGEKLCS